MQQLRHQNKWRDGAKVVIDGLLFATVCILIVTFLLVL